MPSKPSIKPMRNLYIAVFTVLVLLQQAINPVQVTVAEPALAISQAESTAKQDYDLNLNTNTLSLSVKDKRPTFVDAVVKPLKASQEAKAKADAEAALKAQQLKSIAKAGPAANSTKLVIGGDDAFAKLRFCEAGGNYNTNTGNGYYGAYQYDMRTWGNYSGYARPDLAPPEVQDAKARETQSRRGWSPWPSCARRLGLL